jgi:serine/threonine protein kinase
MQSEEWDTVGDFKVSRGILLGKGQSCEVYYGYNCKNGQKVAAKKIDINKINSKIEKQLENEIKNLRELKSPFIVRLLGYYRHENFYYLFL